MEFNNLNTFNNVMQVIPNKHEQEGCEWWVVAIIDDDADALLLKEWLPSWKETRERYSK